MRLINVQRLELEQFQQRGIPPYAILSHTWGEEEVSFADFTSSGTQDKVRQLKGYAKILGCCRKASSEGYDWIWVDTCCIDKSSSAELSEAINSMFRWYEAADVCYAYLSDVDSGEDPRLQSSTFRRSRWWTRGWTLQELLAPAEVVFLASDWVEIGTKELLRDVVSELTGISASHLTDDDDDGGEDDDDNNDKNGGWRRASTAQKLSWAARRATTRLEDESYCLMGLFGINMPLLYGEGSNAFQRLQHQILQSTDDQSLLAWRPSARDGVTDFTLMGLLALSPRNFAHSGEVEPYPLGTSTHQHSGSDAIRGYDEPLCQVLASRLIISAPIFKFTRYNRLNPSSRFSPREMTPLVVMVEEHDGVRREDASGARSAAKNDATQGPPASEFGPLLVLLNCSISGTRDRAPLGLVILPGPDARGAYVRANCRFIACERWLISQVPNTTIHCRQQFRFKLDLRRHMAAGTDPAILVRYTPHSMHSYRLASMYPLNPQMSSHNDSRMATWQAPRQIKIFLGNMASGNRPLTERPRIAHLIFAPPFSSPPLPYFGVLFYQDQQTRQLWASIEATTGGAAAAESQEGFYRLVRSLNASQTREDKLSALRSAGETSAGNTTCISTTKLLRFQLTDDAAVVIRVRRVRKGDEFASLRDVICITLEKRARSAADPSSTIGVAA